MGVTQVVRRMLHNVLRIKGKMSMDIKQELRQALDSPNVDLPWCDYLTQLCQKALAEIERLEASHCKEVSAARQVEALERIAKALEQAAMYGWGSVGSEQLG